MRSVTELLQDETRTLWDERTNLVRRLSRMESYATQRREAVRRFVDAVNDDRLDGAIPLKEHPLFLLLARDVGRWEDWDADHEFLGGKSC